MDSLLKEVSEHVGMYMDEALVKGFANFMNRLFVKRGFLNSSLGIYVRL